MSDDADDDWFERALRESDGEDQDIADETSDEISDGEAGDAGDGEFPERSPEETPAGEATDESTAGSTEGEATFGGGSADEQGPPEPTETPSVADETADSGDDPFGEDFSAAFERAPGPGGESGEQAPFGGGDGASGGDEFGFGGPGEAPDGTEDFDEEEFESDIERLKLGVEGLDEMILGGVPTRSLIVAIGSAGTGKTTFGLQFLRQALLDGERAVFIALEESRERIVNTADEKGWDFSGYVEDEQLAILDLDPIEMANSLSSIRNDLPRLVDDFDAERLVLDSVSLLEMMYDSPSRRRSEVFEFTRSLKEAGVTTLMTSEASEENPYNSRYGIIEYLADAVFVLQYVRPSDFRETRLAIEIQKIRDANHSRETKPYELTSEGISVYRQANIF